MTLAVTLPERAPPQMLSLPSTVALAAAEHQINFPSERKQRTSSDRQAGRQAVQFCRLKRGLLRMQAVGEVAVPVFNRIDRPVNNELYIYISLV